MLGNLIARIKWLSTNSGTDIETIRTVETTLRANLPEQYRNFLLQMDGGNGRTTRGANICFFSTRELPEIDIESNIEEFLPGWLIFSSDLGGRSYLLRRNGDSERIVGCSDEEFSEQALTEEAENLPDFLRNLGD